jgi:hypothetical protein
MLAAGTVAAGVSAVFVLLGGVQLAHSAIRNDEYGGPVRHISIVGASRTREGAVKLRVLIIGWKMYPALVGKRFNKRDGGHWAIFVDRRCNNVSASRTTGTTKPLKKALHAIYGELANNDGSYLSPRVKSNRITVRILRGAKKPAAPARACVRNV